MESHDILGGKVHLYRRPDSQFWYAHTSIEGKQRKTSTKEDSLFHAKQVAEDWYLLLRGKSRAGILNSEETFARAAKVFLTNYGILTEGQRSEKWTEGHEIRLRVHLVPYFGEMGVSKIGSGTAQDYLVHRMQSKGQVNPNSKSKNPPKEKPPSRSTIHNEIVTLRLVLKDAVRRGTLSHLPDLSMPYRKQGKVEHRPWFSPEEYKQLYTATRAYAAEPFHDTYKWNAEQLHDYVLFMTNTGLRPDEAQPDNLLHQDVSIVEDTNGTEILKIKVRGKRGVGYCTSTPSAVRPYRRLLERAKPLKAETRRQAQKRRKEGGEVPPAPELQRPQPNDPVFPGSNVKIFNKLLKRIGLKTDRDGKNRTAYSLRHTYICMRLTEGANIYDVARNCRTSVEMIQKFYAAHIRDLVDATALNVMRAKPKKRKKAAVRVEELEDA